MIYGFERPDAGDSQLAALTKEIRVRILNCSATGCLVESNGAIPVGTVGLLRVAFDGSEFEDTVQVVRCQPIVGAGAICHVGTKFLSTTPPYADTLRHAIRRDLGKLAGWLRTPEPR
jgi:PilZ domain